MLPADDPFSPLLKSTLETNYDPEISQHQDIDVLRPPLPLSLYDRHIASHLVLKNIVYSPSITHLLSKVCEVELQSFLKLGHQFSTTGYGIFPLKCPPEQFMDASNVGSYYYRYIGDLCTRYAYKLALRPDDQTWDSIFRMVVSGRGPNLTTESWLEVDELISTKPELFNGLSEASKDKVKSLQNNYPRLATWDIFAMTDKAREMFQSLKGNRPFAWVSCRTLGSHTVSHLNPPPDAKRSLVSGLADKVTKSRRGPSNRRPMATKIAKTVTVPNLPPRKKSYRPDFCHYIQHAWAKATMYDSTFIILHCGRYERIGFRHRGSQTLFLSGIIDTINIQNPSYMKLHIGLHTAIVQDVLRRQELIDKRPEKEKTSTLKRPADHLDNEAPKQKRQKNTPVAESDTLQIGREIARRKLALIRLEYGAFCSPVPSSFIRRGPSCIPGYAPREVSEEEKQHPKQMHYKVDEYFCLTLGEPLGHGAVGVVHPATLELTLESGEILSHDLAMKFAFTNEQQKLMANEYQVYGQLSRKEGVEGIVTVHGLFLDPETRILGMLMDNGGRTLRCREIDRGGDEDKISVTEEERKAYVKALKSLHKAGIRHNDLRADNLLINSRNEVFIIDFDRANSLFNKREAKKELDRLEVVLDGSD